MTIRKVLFAIVLWATTSTALVPLEVLASDIASLDDISHIHAIAVDSSNTERLYLATHSGLFLAAPNAAPIHISEESNDLMGFVAHPTDPQVFYASGHSSKGENLGVMRSGDGGKTWSQWAKGADDSVDFHAMAASKADPNILYGLYKGIQISRDAGRSWQIAGQPSAEVFDIAASVQDPDTVYAATRAGLFLSRNGGSTWKSADTFGQPVTMVRASANGELYAFVYGIGLVTASEATLAWQSVSNSYQDRFLIDLAVDPSGSAHLYAVTDTGVVVTSKDGGETWISFEGSLGKTAKVIGQGQQLYEENCQSCHGLRGVGENPNNIYEKNEYGFVAPPLNDTAHAWHHPDSGLADTILNGSPRNKRMRPWRGTLSQEDAQALVAYIKSLWSFRSLSCQGVRHTRCM